MSASDWVLVGVAAFEVVAGIAGAIHILRQWRIDQ